VRYAERKKYSAPATCVKQVFVSHVTPLLKRFALTAMMHVARFVGSIYRHAPAIHVVNWCVKIMEQESMNPRFVITVGRVTYE
jgi:hypothetical protein